MLISALVKDPEADLTTILPKKGATAAAAATTTSSTWTAETAKVAAPTGKSSKAAATAAVAAGKPIPLSAAQPNISSKHVTAQLQRLGWILDGAKLEQSPELLAASLPAASANALASALNASRSAAATKTSNASLMANSRSSATAPRHAAAAEKRAAALAAAAAAAAANTKTTMSYTSAIMTTAGRQAKISATTTQTFAAKLTDSSVAVPTNTTQVTGKPRSASSASVLPQAVMPQSPSKHSAASAAARNSTAGIPSLIDSAPLAKPLMSESMSNGQAVQQDRKTPQEQQPVQQQPIGRHSNQETPLQQYSLFNDSKPVWECENDAASQKGMNFASAAAAGGAASVSGQVIAAPKFLDNLPPQVDASKAPGYRGNSMSSPVLPKAVISVPANFQGPPSNFSEPPPPIGMNTSPNQKAIGRPGGHGDIGQPAVSQSDNYRHMMSERAADMQRASAGHLLMSSSNMIEQPPPNQQQQYTLAPSPGYDHQHPPLLKVVQQSGGGQGHHQDASQQHAMMNAYQSNQQVSANPNMPHYQSGANANQASAASMSPPSMHSR